MIHASIVCEVQIGDIPEHSTQCTLHCKIAEVFRPEKAYKIGTNTLNADRNGEA